MKITLLVTLLTLFSCSNSEKNYVIEEPCACTQEYRPVCGLNGKTYPNACVAKCSQVQGYVEGVCSK